MEYDHTAYHGGASTPDNCSPKRKSTHAELAVWMNNMASSVLSGVIHWITNGEIHFARLGDGREVLERGIL